MTEWVRLRVDERCGSCRNRIPAGTVLLEIRNAAGKRVRCASCAREDWGEPAEVPPLEVPQPSLPLDAAPAKAQGFVRVNHGQPSTVRSALALAQRDFKQQQSGESDV